MYVYVIQSFLKSNYQIELKHQNIGHITSQNSTFSENLGHAAVCTDVEYLAELTLAVLPCRTDDDSFLCFFLSDITALVLVHRDKKLKTAGYSFEKYLRFSRYLKMHIYLFHDMCLNP
jgi:hypothetical protein